MSESTYTRDEFAFEDESPEWVAIEKRRGDLRNRLFENQAKREQGIAELAALNAEVEKDPNRPNSQDIEALIGLFERANDLRDELDQINKETDDLLVEAKQTGYLDSLKENSATPIAVMRFGRNNELNLTWAVDPRYPDGIVIFAELNGGEREGGKQFHSTLNQEEAVSFTESIAAAAKEGARGIASMWRNLDRQSDKLAGVVTPDEEAFDEARSKSPLIPGLFSWDDKVKN